MTSGIIWKEILLFSIPLILGNLFQQLYNIVDSIIVGNVVGSNALAAVGAGGSVIQLLVGFCIGASTGAGVVTSQYYGAKNEDGVKKAVHTTLAISFSAGLILSVIGVLLAPWILKVMDTPEEVFDQASSYLQIFFGGIIFSIVYNMSAGILNAVGNSRKTLNYLVIATFTNIGLDLLFVWGLRMGVVGAALATVISQLVSCIFILRFLAKSKDMYKIRFRNIKFYDNLLPRILRIGLPTGVQSVVISLSNILVQSSVNSFGATVMASYAAFNKIDGIILLPIMSISMAATTFCGQNFGAQEVGRIKKGMKTSIGMGSVYALVVGAVMLIFGPYIIHIFTGDQAVIESGIYMMNIMYPFYWLLAIMNIAIGAIRGVGRTMEGMIVSIFSLCVCRVLWIFVALRISHHLGLLIAGYPITWLIGAVIMMVYVKKGRWLRLEEMGLPPQDREKE